MENKLIKFSTLCPGQLLFLFLITWPCLRGDASGCKNMIWLPEQSGSYLRNHSIQNMTVSSQSMCQIMCYLSEKTCLSFNFHQSTSTCEINDSDEFQHPDDLIPMHGYSYRGTKNGCQSNPCPANATCQADLTQDGAFSCLCPNGFTGTSCEIDIDECTSADNICPANTTCLNKVGSYECPCKDGYKKTGQQCLPKTGTKDLPGKSCLSILTSGDSQGTGEYWLDPKNTGNPIKVFCDMETDGGGWTKLKTLYLQTNAIPFNNHLNTFDTAIAGGLRNEENNIPSGPAMFEIHQVMGFHQIHFYCHKKSVRTVVSIMTKNNTAGQQVVRYFTTAVNTVDFPAACNSFDRLPEDTSFLSRNCRRWGKDVRSHTGVNKWGLFYFHGPSRISTCPFAIADAADGYGFRCYNYPDNRKRRNGYGSCDDGWENHQKPLSVNDTWQIAVR